MKQLNLNQITFYHLLSAILFFAFLGQACTPTRSFQDRTPDDRGFYVKVGDKIPEMEFNYTSGEKVNVDDLKGNVVLLQFTASWCGVCRKEMPHIENEIWQPWKDKGLKVIGIDLDEPLDVVETFVEKTGITYPVSLDPKGELFAKIAAPKSGVTRNVVLNKKGKIVMLTRLFNKQEFGKMKNVIEAHL